MKRSKRKYLVFTLTLALVCAAVFAVSPWRSAVFSADDASYYVADTDSVEAFLFDGESVLMMRKLIITDTDSDGTVTASDARGVLRVALGLDVFSGDRRTLDVDEDGEVSASDARALLRYALEIDKLYIDSTGAVRTGWCTDLAGRDRYFDVNGALRTGFFTDSDGRVWYSDATGKLRSGLINDAGRLYYTRSDGGEVNGITTVDGVTYFFEHNAAVTGFRTAGGATYCFGSDYTLVRGLADIGPDTYYFDEYGRMLTGFKEFPEGWRRFDDSGKMQTGFVNVGGVRYYFGADGIMATGLQTISDKLYLFDGAGQMLFGLQTFGGRQYFFEEDGSGRLYRDPEKIKIAMIGDSLVLNMNINNVTDRIDCYGKVSLHVYDFFSKSVSGSSRCVIDEISGRGYDVVVILVGINDMGMSDTSWANYYAQVIDGVRERAPDAEIIAHALLPVNDSVARANGYTVTNSQIRAKNAVIRSVAEREGVRYIDAAPAVADASGSLPAGGAADGIHFYRASCAKWAQWLVNEICYG
ncbi:MAG: hypothetical protein K6C36_02890 [Clostridia bacterium]|nr:hypothetical protein [Clostridia bacterium]